MKHHVTRFKSLNIAIKELAPFIIDSGHLRTGKPLKRFGGMLPREVLANWLLCVTLNEVNGGALTFTTDPTGGDGVIQDPRTNQTWLTEHVFIPPQSANGGADAQTLILNAVEQKRSKGGEAYAAGKTLVVFIDAPAGAWLPNKVARALPRPLYFEAAWVVGLQPKGAGVYTYGVTLLDISVGDAPTYLVHVNRDFAGWEVEVIQ